MQSVSSRIWTRVAVSISCDNNHYTISLCQRFCNILVLWGTTWQYLMLLLRSLKWQISQDCKIPNLFDTLWLLLTRFASMALITASESIVLGFPELTWRKFLKLVTAINDAFTFSSQRFDPVGTHKVLYTILVNINGYIPFLINTLDTMVRVGDFYWLSSHHWL